MAPFGVPGRLLDLGVFVIRRARGPFCSSRIQSLFVNGPALFGRHCRVSRFHARTVFGLLLCGVLGICEPLAYSCGVLLGSLAAIGVGIVPNLCSRTRLCEMGFVVGESVTGDPFFLRHTAMLP